MKTLKKDRRTYLNLQHGRFYGVGKYHMPLLKKQDLPKVDKWIGFNEVKTYKGECTQTGVHFFLDDYQFERVWQRPSVYVRQLSRFAVVATPDFSLYTDYPMVMQLWNHYRKQWLGAYFQHYGITVIPTVSWSTKDSFDFCFDGIPKGAAVMVSTVGIFKNEQTEKLFHQGYEEIKSRLHPSYLISYGELPAYYEADEILPVYANDLS